MNLLDQLSKNKQTEVKEGSIPTNVPPINTKSITSGDILNQTKGTGTKVETEPTVEVAPKKEENPSKASPSVEPSADNGTVADPESWTKESAFKEVKRLRDENKTYRLKYEEKLTSLKTELEQRLSSKDQEVENLRKAQQELSEIKEKEADNKRSLEDKLAHRESVATEYKIKLEATQREYEHKLKETQAQLDRYHADIAAQKEVYKQRLQTEVSSIPEKFKEVAELIIKGAGDEREALVAISEAKLKGIFEDKTVVVNHSVPGARDGARATNERLEDAKRADRNKMTSSQKIKAALTGIRGGEVNPAFRNR